MTDPELAASLLRQVREIERNGAMRRNSGWTRSAEEARYPLALAYSRAMGHMPLKRKYRK